MNTVSFQQCCNSYCVFPHFIRILSHVAYKNTFSSSCCHFKMLSFFTVFNPVLINSVFPNVVFYYLIMDVKINNKESAILQGFNKMKYCILLKRFIYIL